MRLTLPRLSLAGNILKATSTATPTTTPTPTPTPAAAKTETLTIQHTPAAKPSAEIPAYLVARTKSNRLPVYLKVQAGGSKKTTLIRKVQGDASALKADIAKMLRTEAVLNPITGHVVVKGSYVPKITQWLTEKGF